jgi:hypothetical protein
MEQITPHNVSECVVYELCIETTKILKGKQDALKNIKWTNGEANIDTEYSELACQCCTLAWETIKQKSPKYSGICITCEIPDINITFSFPDGRNEKHKIELKSSKSTKMPGSTIKNLNINQPLIYCLRPTNNSDAYKIRCSQYHSAMGDSNIDLFQDRTPRPFINFERMSDIDDNISSFQSKDKHCWIMHYAKCAINRIDGTHSIQKSWQDDMVKIMKKHFIDEYIRNTSTEQFQLDKLNSQVENARI